MTLAMAPARAAGGDPAETLRIWEGADAIGLGGVAWSILSRSVAVAAWMLSCCSLDCDSRRLVMCVVMLPSWYSNPLRLLHASCMPVFRAIARRSSDFHPRR